MCAGTLHPVFETKKETCEAAFLSVIPTEAECQKAVTMLTSSASKAVARAQASLSYCSGRGNYFSFESTGRREHNSFHCGLGNFRCLCKKGDALKSFPRPLSAHYTHARMHTHARTHARTTMLSVTKNVISPPNSRRAHNPTPNPKR